VYRFSYEKSFSNPMMDFPGISSFVKMGIFKEKFIQLDNTLALKRQLNRSYHSALASIPSKANVVEKSYILRVY
jgi:hypothetical protein